MVLNLVLSGEASDAPLTRRGGVHTDTCRAKEISWPGSGPPPHPPNPQCPQPGKMVGMPEVPLFLAVLGAAVIGTIVHAGRRNRWLWALLIFLAPGVGLLAYWLVEGLRPRDPDWPSRLA